MYVRYHTTTTFAEIKGTKTRSFERVETCDSAPFILLSDAWGRESRKNIRTYSSTFQTCEKCTYMAWGEKRWVRLHVTTKSSSLLWLGALAINQKSGHNIHFGDKNFSHNRNQCEMWSNGREYNLQDNSFTCIDGCGHGPIPADHKGYMTESSASYAALCTIIDENMIRDLSRCNPNTDTSSVESFHALSTKFAWKRGYLWVKELQENTLGFGGNDTYDTTAVHIWQWQKITLIKY